MLQVVNAGDDYLDEIIINIPVKTTLGAEQILIFIYGIVSIVLLLLLVQMLFSIFKLIRGNEKIKIENINFINTDAAKGTPFSFFQFIFWNKQIDMQSAAGIRIFKHELAHIQEWHSWDKMFINLVLIVFWINPIFWLVRKELSMLHEFIADKKAVEDGDTAAFAAMILEVTYPQRTLFLTNNFFYSPIKRRLMMLAKIKSTRTTYLSRLLVLPLIAFVFAAFTLKAKEIGADKKIKKSIEQMINKITGADNIGSTLSADLTKSRNIMTDRKITVVIDAGHGGIDGGARNKDGIFEKDIALQLIKKINALNTNENIKIILTRTEDVFSDPNQKAAFAKAQNPDLFISVHLNNTPKEKWNTVSGLEIYISKDGYANSEKSKTLASSIIGSFKNNYELNVPFNISQRQKGVYVIQVNEFPSVLIEAGFLTNDKDLAYLQSKKGQEAFAKNVLDAINNYASSNNFKTIHPAKPNTIIYNDTIGYYKGKAVIKLITKPNSDNCTITYSDYTTQIISIKNAREAKLFLPPPAPPPPTFNIDNSNNNSNSHFKDLDPSGSYDGKAVLMVSRNKNDSINLQFSDRTFKNISLKEAKSAGLPVPPTPSSTRDDKIFTKTEVEPEFPGGKDAWRKFLQQNLDGSIAVKENLKYGSYVFVTKFIVHEDGSLSDFTSEKNVNDTIAKHCIEVIKKGPKWKPAVQNGYIVAAYRKQPITFVVASE